ncbi:MAG: glycosyltransferase family 2 protein [Gemmatimonadaceae bacterium]
MSETTAGRSRERPVFSRDLSVVIGSVDAARSIRACLASVVESCRGIDTEIILVDASNDGTADSARADFPNVHVIEMPADTLVPRLWSEGIRHARGEKVALLTAHCEVDAHWARELGVAIDAGAAGAGGPIALAEDASRVDEAVYFTRYSAFLPSSFSGVTKVRDIAGDNAMYNAASLRRHMASFTEGFWEVEFHAIIHSEGEYLLMCAAAPVTFGHASSLATISKHRFLHGRHFGAWRVARRRSDAARMIIGAPFVPLVLFQRIARRAWKPSVDRQRFISASPLILRLTTLWSLGELLGAFDALNSSREKNADRS